MTSHRIGEVEGWKMLEGTPIGSGGASKVRGSLLVSSVILIVALTTGGLSWVPVLKVAGIDIVVEDLGRVIVIVLILPSILISGMKSRISTTLVLLMLWLLWASLVMVIHSGYDGLHILRMWLVEILFAFAIANCRVEVLHSLRTISMIALGVFVGAIVVSAYKSGVSLGEGSLEYLRTLDRDKFVGAVVRKVLNAFVTTSVDADKYSGVQINKLSATFVLFYSLLVFSSAPASVVGRLLWRFAIGICVASILVLFSSSAILVFGVVTLLVLLKGRRVSSISRLPLYAIVLAVVGFFVGDMVEDYLSANIASDGGSRQSRLFQYGEAFRLIGEAVVSGHGFVTIEGAVIHNWLLFSWVSSGIVGALLVVGVYLSIGRMMVMSLRVGRGDLLARRYAGLAISLYFLFVMRTLVGGGGGVGGGAGMLGLAIGILIYEALMEKEGVALVAHPAQEAGRTAGALSVGRGGFRETR